MVETAARLTDHAFSGLQLAAVGAGGTEATALLSAAVRRGHRPGFADGDAHSDRATVERPLLQFPTAASGGHSCQVEGSQLAARNDEFNT
jgi:hypothetical protein